MIIILPETSIRISRNKSIINYISCVEIQSAQGENTGTWTDQISIQFPDTTDPLKLGPIIIDVKQSNCQSHLRLTPVKSIKKIRSIKLWSFMSRYTHALLSFPRSFLAVNHHNKKNWAPSILTHNLWLIFMGMKQKEILMADSKKLSFSKSPILNIFLRKGLSSKPSGKMIVAPNLCFLS